MRQHHVAPLSCSENGCQIQISLSLVSSVSKSGIHEQKRASVDRETKMVVISDYHNGKGLDQGCMYSAVVLLQLMQSEFFPNA